MATIITKNSSTASSVPAAGSLQQGELAVNVTDKKLYTKDSSAAVVKLVGSLGNQEASAVAITGGTINGTAIGGTSTSTGAFTTVSASGGFTGNLTGNASTVTNGVYTTGSYADPTWITSLAGSKITGNISGNATNVTGTVAIANGGTGLTALGTGVQTALGQTVTGSGGIVLANSPALVTPNLGTPSAATLTNATGLPVSTGISGLGTNVATALGVSVGSVGSVVVNGGVLGTPSSGTLTNATGLPLSTGVTGTLAVANGGTGQTTANAAFNALAPSQTSNAGRYLKTDGTNTSWDLLDISTADITGTLPVANGGTGLTSFTANGVLYASSSSALATGSALTYDGSNFRVNSGTSWATSTGGVQLSMDGAGADAYLTTYYDTHTLTLGAGVSFKNSIKISGSSASNNINFRVNNSDAMVLNSTGLGIGTSSPAYKLDVSGSVIRLNNSGSTADIFLTDSGTTNGHVRLRGESNAMKFITGNGISATLDSSGNLGLGVTPSAWSLLKAVQIGNASFAGYSATGYLMTNAYFDGSVYKYTSSNYANLYTQNNSVGQHAWYIAGSGTAGNAISFTQAMTLDASGNLGVGTTSPSFASGSGIAVYGATAARLALKSNATGANNGLQMGIDSGGLAFIEQRENNALLFSTNATERARITSGGDFQVNASGSDPYSSSSGSGISLNNANYIAAARSGGACLYIARQTSDGDVTEIWRGGTKVGSISVTTTATAYNTSSDYRLKNITGPVTGSGAFIDALKPKVGTWKADGSKFVGFLAHEVQEVSPQSVTGTKDAVDEEGKPIMQAMEYGSAEFIANIIAELQSLRARVAQLEAK